MMKSAVLLLLATPSLAWGFVPQRSSTRAGLKLNNVQRAKDSLDPVDLDLDRAKDCAEHFGKCSVKEMEKLKDGLHQQRLQETLFGTVQPSTEEAFDHRLLEEELDLQLSLLKEEQGTSTMFTEKAEETMHPEHHHVSAAEVAVENIAANKNVLLMEEEGVFEAAAIMAVIAGVAVLPQLLHL